MTKQGKSSKLKVTFIKEGEVCITSKPIVWAVSVPLYVKYSKKRGKEIGAENVFDFSIGNPSVPAPALVQETIARSIAEIPSVDLHGYTSAQGDKKVREKIAENYRNRFGVALGAENLYMTCGAAASLVISLKAIANEGDEFIVLAPYFPEYVVFVASAGGKLVVVQSDEKSMLPDFEGLKKALSPRTKGVIINSPNNPSGVVYGEQTMEKLASLLRAKSREYGRTIYLLSDEPYRELVYDAETIVPCPMRYYENTLVCYSYSKSLSLPGERIGYIAVNPNAKHAKEVYLSVCGAARALGYVCAPALFQKVAAECDGLTADLGVYKRNRDLLYHALNNYGFTCIYPDGAFYLFVKAAKGKGADFCALARKYELLLVDGADFGAENWVRIAYCVPTERIEKALPLFEKIAKECGIL